MIRRTFLKKSWRVGFIGYIGVVIVGTLCVRGRSLREWIDMLVPHGRFRDILMYPLQHHHPVTFAKLYHLADIGVNILLFFPLGLAVFLVLRRIFHDSIRTILVIALLLGMTFSIGIETFQALVPNRIPSVSDVIANTGGVVFGAYILYFWQEIKQRGKKLTS